MEVFVVSFRLPKAGNTEEECEDAFFPKINGLLRGNRFHFAVSDGASEAMLSGQWAEILTKVFSRPRALDWHLEDSFEKALKSWESWKRNYLLQRKKRGKPIQWYEEPGLQAGAFSTILALSVADSHKNGKRGAWKAVAVGDSCLFQIRDDRLRVKFPIEASNEMNNRPLLISSNPSRNAKVFKAIRKRGGEWHIGDQFYLVTDALANWFLREYEAGNSPWNVLKDFDSQDREADFVGWISGLRRENRLRNDDVTMVRLDIV